MLSLDQFAELFRGNRNAYGVHIPELDPVEGVKASGKSFVEKSPVSQELYKAHIEGKTSIGIIPIDENNNIRFMAIDVDVYPLDPKRYCALIDKYNLPFTGFRSKSGGMHLFCFFKGDVNAGDALDCLNVLRHVLLLAKETETFPKQRRVTSKGLGNFINLPYFGGKNTTRYAYNATGEPLDFEEAIQWCYDRRTTLKALQASMAALPLSCAPPCLQAMLMNNEASVTARNRNIFLFNAAIYLKARWKEDFSERLFRVNDELDQPLDELELETTVIASHNRGSYSYQCEEACLAGHCDREICKRRDYGKGSGTVSNFAFERLIQVKSNPPYYKWTVNGIEMVFYSESELRTQDKFMDLCMRHLHRLPNRLKADAWTEILNLALQELEIEKVTLEEDISSYTLWFEYLREFLTERAEAQRISQVHTGLVFLDRGSYWFKVEAFLQWLDIVKRFRGLSLSQIHYHLKNLGVHPGRLYDETEKKTIRAWKCPAEVVSLIEEAAVSDSYNPDPLPVPVQTSRARAQSGIHRLSKLLDELPDEATLDFSDLKEKEKF